MNKNQYSRLGPGWEENYYKEGTAFDNWIVGFINGEGCFHLHKDGHKVFFIEHTDKNSLDLIKDKLNLGGRPASKCFRQRY